MTVQLIRLPTVDPQFANDLFVLPPIGMDVSEAVREVERIIVTANIEDAANENGGCDDGLTVGESVKRRLGELGFGFPEVTETIKWDAVYGPEDLEEVSGLAP